MRVTTLAWLGFLRFLLLVGFLGFGLRTGVGLAWGGCRLF